METFGIHAASPSLLDQVNALKPQTKATEPAPPLTDVAPTAADQPCMVSFAATDAPTNVQTFLNLPTSSSEAITAFFKAHQGESATTMVRSGTSYVVSVGGETIKMDYKTLAAALKEGKLPSNSPLGASLLVFDAASRSHLPQTVIRNVLSQMQQGLAGGQTAQQVLQSGYHNVVLATQVESYARHKDGLAFDQQRVTGPSAAPAGDEQQHLATSLKEFEAAYSKAQATGDYALAFDALQTFFQQGSSSSSVPHWKGRSDKLASDLSLTVKDFGLAEEVLNDIKDALLASLFGKPDDGTPSASPAKAPAPEALSADKDSERVSKRRAFLLKVARDDPKVSAATAKSVASAKALAESARILANRTDSELKKAFKEVSDGLGQWVADHESKTDFESAYTQSTIEYLVLMDRFADALEALKADREPKHRSTSLPPDAVDQPDVLASFIESIAERVAQAWPSVPKVDEAMLHTLPPLIDSSTRALVELCRLAV